MTTGREFIRKKGIFVNVRESLIHLKRDSKGYSERKMSKDVGNRFN